jgi:hypothetical protein
MGLVLVIHGDFMDFIHFQSHVATIAWLSTLIARLASAGRKGPEPSPSEPRKGQRQNAQDDLDMCNSWKNLTWHGLIWFTWFIYTDIYGLYIRIYTWFIHGF